MRFARDPSVRIASGLRSAGAIAMCFALAACATGASPREDSDAIRAHDRKVCTDYGFRIGAEDFAHCIQALQDQRARSTR
jgi:hypothetical protein